MNIYIDLSLLLQIILGYTSLYFCKTLLVVKSKWYIELVFSILSGFGVYLIYLNLYISILLYIIYIAFFLFIIFKRNFLKSLFLYLFCYSLLTFIIDKLSIYNQVYNFILTINDKRGILSFLFAPIFFISLVISTKIVDSLYHLHNYKTSCYLSKNNKKYFYSGYFDTGNTLKHDDVPVIFINKDKYMFNIEKGDDIQINGINGKEFSEVQSCLLSLEDKNESYFVYVVLVDIKDFHGCEILLNAYLL